jgi:hypothetical protein
MMMMMMTIVVVVLMTIMMMITLVGVYRSWADFGTEYEDHRNHEDESDKLDSSHNMMYSQLVD